MKNSYLLFNILNNRRIEAVKSEQKHILAETITENSNTKNTAFLFAKNVRNR